MLCCFWALSNWSLDRSSINSCHILEKTQSSELVERVNVTPFYSFSNLLFIDRLKCFIYLMRNPTLNEGCTIVRFWLYFVQKIQEKTTALEQFIVEFIYHIHFCGNVMKLMKKHIFLKYSNKYIKKRLYKKKNNWTDIF